MSENMNVETTEVIEDAVKNFDMNEAAMAVGKAAVVVVVAKLSYDFGKKVLVPAVKGLVEKVRQPKEDVLIVEDNVEVIDAK